MDYRIFEQKTHDALALHIRHVAVYCLSPAACRLPVPLIRSSARPTALYGV